jgi:stage II sporulation protein M
MTLFTVQRSLRHYLQQHSSSYLFVFVLFVMGVIFGAVIVNALSLAQKQDLAAYLLTFFNGLDQNSAVTPKEAFQHSLGNHLKFVGLIWLMGLSVIGLPLILVFIFLKGVLIGFTVAFLVSEMAWQGALFSLVSVVPQNLLIIPAFIVCGVAATSFSLLLVRNYFIQRRSESIWHSLGSYTSVMMLMAGVLFAASLFEAYVSPVLMKMVTQVM